MVGWRVDGAAAAADLDRLREVLEPEILGVTVEAAKIAMAVAQAETPVRTGATRSKWFVNVLGGSHRGRGVVVVLDHEYNSPGKFPRQDRKLGYSLLDILEYGSRAHAIYPRGVSTGQAARATWYAQGGQRTKVAKGSWVARGAHVLRFFAGKMAGGGFSGGYVFARRVSHPGTKAYAMTRKAAAVGERAWLDLALQAVDRAIKGG